MSGVKNGVNSGVIFFIKWHNVPLLYIYIVPSSTTRRMRQGCVCREITGWIVSLSCWLGVKTKDYSVSRLRLPPTLSRLPAHMRLWKIAAKWVCDTRPNVLCLFLLCSWDKGCYDLPVFAVFAVFQLKLFNWIITCSF